MTSTCDGHPAGAFDPMGVTVYCDGSCKAEKRNGTTKGTTMAREGNVRKYLDVSTSNLTEEEANFRYDTENVIHTEHGFGAWVWVPPDDEYDSGIRDRGYVNLVAVIKIARELGCPWRVCRRSIGRCTNARG